MFVCYRSAMKASSLQVFVDAFNKNEKKNYTEANHLYASKIDRIRTYRCWEKQFLVKVLHVGI